MTPKSLSDTGSDTGMAKLLGAGLKFSAGIFSPLRFPLVETKTSL